MTNSAAGQSYEELVADALAATFSGWNFDYLTGRARERELPWSYEEMARAELTDATRLLDLNTGGGETLIRVLQARSVGHAAATESWEPNIPVARENLRSSGIEVRAHPPGQPLPAADGEFDLVLNRHGAADPAELSRVLTAGGVYLTQAVGRSNDLEFNAALDGPRPGYSDEATLDREAAALRRHGFEIVASGEGFADCGFLDVGAVVFHLTAIPWQVPGFDVDAYGPALRRLDATIRRDGSFTVRHHRYFIKAIRH
jgi:SAM-dependent methyltransferase